MEDYAKQIIYCHSLHVEIFTINSQNIHMSTQVMAFCSQFLMTLVLVSDGIFVHFAACCFFALSFRTFAMLFMISFTLYTEQTLRHFLSYAKFFSPSIRRYHLLA